uniref:Neurotransmitter-gated ion-channel transmembrane domain-containing protein n=1 Tax=Trichobilharzia regenti TaxID=157069 RepID=A0AA85K877_TRIRE|nr:unnamed protein product [Trichobilharzia regenti]
MGIITVSMFLCCITVNLHFRTAETQQPPKWLRKFTALMGWLLGINIDELELVEETVHLKIRTIPYESQNTPSVNNTHKKQTIHYNNSSSSGSLKELSNSQHHPLYYSASGSLSSIHDNPKWNKLSHHSCYDRYFNSNDKYCTYYPNISKQASFELRSRDIISSDLNKHNINQSAMIYKNIDNNSSNNPLKCSTCSMVNSTCKCYHPGDISSPIYYYQNTNDMLPNHSDNRQYSMSSNTDLTNSRYSLPINICSDDNRIISCQLNETDVENISLLNYWNNNEQPQDHHLHEHRAPPRHYHQNYEEEIIQATIPPKQKSKIKPEAAIPQPSTSRLQHFYPISLNKLSKLTQKERQSLRRIKQDISYITKAARQLQGELKERDLKERIIEQWKIVGIVLDRIFFIIYFITVLLSTLLFHPTLIDDSVDD